MIGNDIIDLRLSKTESNRQRKGWHDKIFCAEEQFNIKHSESPKSLTWLYWSMKEAAYKIYNRQTGKRFFLPAKLICTIQSLTDEKAMGNVVFDNNTYHTESLITQHFIHTIASTDPAIALSKVLISDYKNALQHQSHLRLLKDNEDLPYIMDMATGKTFIASKSHHGNFEALVF